MVYGSVLSMVFCYQHDDALAYTYFSVNIAFTWADTDVVCGLNSSVGAGAVCAIALILAIGNMGMGRTFSFVSTEA